MKLVKKFAKEHSKDEDEEVPTMLSRREIEKRIASGIGTLDMYMCPRCKTYRDIDRYMCPHCRTNRNIKCDWCGNHFCEVCINPESHDCLEYALKLKKSARYTEPYEELVNTHEQELLIDTSSNGHITAATEQSKLLIETKVKSIVDDGSKVKVKEEIITEKRVSIWRKLLSIFGFGN